MCVHTSMYMYNLYLSGIDLMMTSRQVETCCLIDIFMLINRQCCADVPSVILYHPYGLHVAPSGYAAGLPNLSSPPVIIIPHVQSALDNLHQRFSMFKGLRCAYNFFWRYSIIRTQQQYTYINKCPTRCNCTQFFCKLLYMFRVVATKLDQYQMLQIQFFVLLIMGAETTRTMQSSLQIK